MSTINRRNRVLVDASVLDTVREWGVEHGNLPLAVYRKGRKLSLSATDIKLGDKMLVHTIDSILRQLED